ncbi:MAG: type II toxin-antitoxin system HicA family toxin [Bryobacterales bacterium]|nr:type II toxin-antitoxin system HicA family toxin [Bryobacterales bacterium]
MNRRDFIRELEAAGCSLKRSGGRHDIYHNKSANLSSPVPRHSEVPDSLCKLIRKQPGLTCLPMPHRESIVIQPKPPSSFAGAAPRPRALAPAKRHEGGVQRRRWSS